MQEALAPAAGRTLTGPAFKRLVRGIQAFVGPGEGRQQHLELRDRQPRESQELPPVSPQCRVGHHEAIVFLFPITSGESESAPTLLRGSHTRGTSRQPPEYRQIG